jgi:hypothetical protein
VAGQAAPTHAALLSTVAVVRQHPRSSSRLGLPAEQCPAWRAWSWACRHVRSATYLWVVGMCGWLCRCLDQCILLTATAACWTCVCGLQEKKQQGAEQRKAAKAKLQQVSTQPSEYHVHVLSLYWCLLTSYVMGIGGVLYTTDRVSVWLCSGRAADRFESCHSRGLAAWYTSWVVQLGCLGYVKRSRIHPEPCAAVAAAAAGAHCSPEGCC